MPKVEELTNSTSVHASLKLPVSVIVATRNEEKNLPRCLDALREAGEVYVIDSASTDATPEIARSYGANVVQFQYRGGWPKKRQWAIENLPLAFDWVLLVDADEALTAELAEEIRQAIQNPDINGYYISLRMYFLGRLLRHGDAGFRKLALFRRGKGRYECRLRDQDPSMADMEIHEHVVVEGATARLKNPLQHHNVESLSRYIRKHDEYSNWEAKVWVEGDARDLTPAFFGTQAQRRRWLKTKFLGLPGAPLWFFLFKYLLNRGFLDGIPGLIYCGLQAVQVFHVKAKIYEIRRARTQTRTNQG
ncbi:MAG TPA: glycosyltransferase family 2 protein [Candidatus Binatia bacterium]|nr:glycosyltransferase family 2 protein [Candidatus Binatia bacterium]